MARSSSRINLNTASKEQLSNLRMVGETRARFIIENRPFKDWEELDKVPGLSKGMIDDMKKSGATIQ